MCGYVNLIKQNLKFSFPFTLVALQVLNSYWELMVAVLQSTVREHLHHRRQVCGHCCGADQLGASREGGHLTPNGTISLKT